MAMAPTLVPLQPLRRRARGLLTALALRLALPLAATVSSASPAAAEPCYEPRPLAPADPPGSYTIPTFEEELIDIAHRSVEREFGFPVSGKSWSRITLDYMLTCPPGGCDPWDRSASVYIRTSDEETIEIARIITPYNTSCGWSIDVTPYMSLLEGDVMLGLYIDTWVGGGVGWLVTTDFIFWEGVAEPRPVHVQRLWHGSPEMGNYQRWLEGGGINEDFFDPRSITIPPAAVRTELRFSMTGHGQRNTGNAGEFIDLLHWLEVDGRRVAERHLWREDCDRNPCSPQGGTWRYSRAGWCPGSDSPMWSVPLDSLAAPGDTVMVDYFLGDYVNFCTEANPECDPDLDCYYLSTCAYDGSAHTPPTLWTESQVVFYESNPLCDLDLFIHERPCALDPAGDPARITFFLENRCAAARSCDQIRLALDGPGALHGSRVAAIDPPLLLPVGGSRLLSFETPIPPSTPAGSYRVTLTALRAATPLASDSFTVELP
jgi:hypothetical protein